MSEDNLKPDTDKDTGVSVPRPPEDEPLEGEVVDKYNNDFARKTNELSDEIWKRIQIIAGVVLGLGSGACLFLVKSAENSFIPMGFLLALFLAMAVPNIAEKQLQRKITIGRTALLITLAAVIIVFGIYGFATGMFTSGAAA